MMSLLIHITMSPGATVSDAGSNREASIVTVYVTGLRAHGLEHADAPVAERLEQGPLHGIGPEATVGDPLRD